MIDIMELRTLLKEFTVLYVEDEKEVNDSISTYLKKIFKQVISAEDGEEGLELYKKNNFDIVITDINMPKLNGLKMSKKIKELNPTQEIIIISAYTEIDYFVESIKIGISTYILKPLELNQMNRELYKIAKRLKAFSENKQYKQYIKDIINEKIDEKNNFNIQKIADYKQTLYNLVDMIEERDTYTKGHSQRVAKYSQIIAKTMGCNDEEVEKVYNAGLLHDIGKMVAPDSVLLKPDKLNDTELEIIQKHPIIGYDLLKDIPIYKEIAEIILYHQERYDGKGYPKGLKANEIPFLSRIMIVADAFDAMTANHIYKKRKSVKIAIKEIEELAGSQFDPEISKIAIKVLKDICI